MLTKSGLRLGISLPQVFPDGNVDRHLIRDFALQAEAVGSDDLWLQERIIGGETSLEPVTLMAYVAALTQRIRLGVSVIILPHRNPIQLAKSLATLDQLSGGRINAGVGLGNANPRLYPAFGLSEDRRVARFNEMLRVIKELWSTPEVNFDGDFYKLDRISVAPRPVQQPGIPIWFGAQSKAAMQRAARHGDAWMGAGAATIADTVAHVGEMRAALKEAGRDERDFTLSKRVYLVVDEDEKRGRARLEDWFAYYYHDRNRAAVSGFSGSPAHCVEVFSSFREAGLHHMLFNTLDDHMGQMEMFTEKVAPYL